MRETFAYPGNQSVTRFEMLDYYLMATTGVPSATTVGGTNTAGTIDLSAQSAEYPDPLKGATPAETKTKAQALFDTQKSRSGGTVFTLQTHNTTEYSVEHMRALLEVITADPSVITLTLREVAHYVRTYNITEDGRIYHGSRNDRTADRRFRGTMQAAGGPLWPVSVRSVRRFGPRLTGLRSPAWTPFCTCSTAAPPCREGSRIQLVLIRQCPLGGFGR